MNCKCKGQVDKKCPCGGEIICSSGCSSGGKALKFKFKIDSPIIAPIVIKPKILITSGNNSIQIQGWTQEPNTGLSGRIWVADLPEIGGTVKVKGYQWISVFAKNPNNSNQFDGVCFTSRGKILELVSF